MKIAVVMDSFKGSISSLEAGYAVKKGILSLLCVRSIWARV